MAAPVTPSFQTQSFLTRLDRMRDLLSGEPGGSGLPAIIGHLAVDTEPREFEQAQSAIDAMLETALPTANLVARRPTADVTGEPVATAVEPVATAVEPVAAAVARASGCSWKSFRNSPAGLAVMNATRDALAGALNDAAPAGILPAEDWTAELARIWQPAFTKDVVDQLVMCLADPFGDPVDRFARMARAALEHSGRDVAVLDRTFWVEEFLAVLPRRLLSELRTVSQRDESVQGLVERLLRQHGDAGGTNRRRRRRASSGTT